MARNLDITLLRTFAAVADHRSMTAAGRVLHLTQGAISQQIARLEALTNRPLLVRDRSGVHPTPSGERLLGKVRHLLALNDEIWLDMTESAVPEPIRLGVPYDLVGTCLAPALKAFSDACPQADLSLVCGTSRDLMQSLDSHRLDLAVLEEPVGSARGECVMIDRLVWVGARGGRAHFRSPVPVSLVAESCIFRPAVAEALRGQDRAWKTVFENGSLDAAVATVRMDLAISAWLASTVPSNLDILPPEAGLPSLPSFAITLHRSDRAAGAAVDELARHIRESVAQPRQAA